MILRVNESTARTKNERKQSALTHCLKVSEDHGTNLAKSAMSEGVATSIGAWRTPVGNICAEIADNASFQSRKTTWFTSKTYSTTGDKISCSTRMSRGGHRGGQSDDRVVTVWGVYACC